MNFIEFKEALSTFTVFSLREIRKIDSSFHRRRLNDWQDKGYIRKVIKGHYIFTDLQLNEAVLFEISNRIHRPSYVSLEMAFSYYHLIPESVYAVTSISSRRPGSYESSLARFIYHKIKSEYFFGYDLLNNGNKRFKIASIEKAILDYFYLNSQLRSEDDFAGLRLNTARLNEQIDQAKLRDYLARFSQHKLTERTNNFLAFIKNA